MDITIKYFGVIAEITQKEDETFQLANQLMIADLRAIITNKYNQLETTNFNIAKNQVIESEESIINEGDEIAFLPPFAGG